MHPTPRLPQIIIVMGVSGAGKTTIGQILAQRLGRSYYDADDFHPAANIEKMRQGVPLNDRDREDWLRAIRALVDRHLEDGRSAVFSCSALKASYRSMLGEGDERIRLLYLKVPRAVVRERLRSREGHFFNPSLLDSQYEALEEPHRAVVVDASRTVDDVVEDALKRLSE